MVWRHLVISLHLFPLKTDDITQSNYRPEIKFLGNKGKSPYESLIFWLYSFIHVTLIYIHVRQKKKKDRKSSVNFPRDILMMFGHSLTLQRGEKNAGPISWPMWKIVSKR